jgi:hypothetical protein
MRSAFQVRSVVMAGGVADHGAGFLSVLRFGLEGFIDIQQQSQNSPCVLKWKDWVVGTFIGGMPVLC